MMKALIILALLGIAVAKVDYTGYKVFRAHPTLKQFETIRSLQETYNLDIWSDFRHEGDFIDFMISPTLQPVVEETLNRFSIAYDIFIEDVEAAARAQLIPTSEDPTAFLKNYQQFDQIVDWIREFASMNAIVSIKLAGISYENRPVFALKISASGEGKRSFVMTCGIHSREWVSPAACINIATMYVDGYYNNDDYITALLSDLDIYIVPVANPDGYVYTWGEDRMWRKTKRVPKSEDSECMTSCIGTDPNRNYNDHWGEPGASASCCSDSYRGLNAFSEIESEIQSNLVAEIGNVKGYIDIHAYSQYWMFPYGYTVETCKDDALLTQIASDSVNAIKSVHGKTYTDGPIADVIYVASGSSADYFYDILNVTCSFAAELRDTGRYGFVLPADQIVPTAEETFAGLNVIADAVVSGKCD